MLATARPSCYAVLKTDPLFVQNKLQLLLIYYNYSYNSKTVQDRRIVSIKVE